MRIELPYYLISLSRVTMYPHKHHNTHPYCESNNAAIYSYIMRTTVRFANNYLILSSLIKIRLTLQKYLYC